MTEEDMLEEPDSVGEETEDRLDEEVKESEPAEDSRDA
jgi:hypothetical protein